MAAANGLLLLPPMAGKSSVSAMSSNGRPGGGLGVGGGEGLLHGASRTTNSVGL